VTWCARSCVVRCVCATCAHLTYSSALTHTLTASMWSPIHTLAPTHHTHHPHSPHPTHTLSTHTHTHTHTLTALHSAQAGGAQEEAAGGQSCPRAGTSGETGEAEGAHPASEAHPHH